MRGPRWEKCVATGTFSFVLESEKVRVSAEVRNERDGRYR